MSNPFFDHPILNSPYDYPARHWELDSTGQPKPRVIKTRRRAEFVTPIPKPKKRRADEQQVLVFDEGSGLSTETQQYDPTSMINAVRVEVDKWRQLPDPSSWRVTPETARLLKHWRHHDFSGIRPFFCQLEAVDTAIWLTEVAPHAGKTGKRFLDHLESSSQNANPEILRLALKLATGAGKTTVMAMLIAWQAVNAARRPQSRKFTRGFLIVTPDLTIRDRLRVLLPNDSESYYKHRELVPSDMIGDIERAKIVITNYHAFRLRERLDLSKGNRALLQGRGAPLQTLETEGQMVQRVMGELMGMNNIMVINDDPDENLLCGGLVHRPDRNSPQQQVSAGLRFFRHALLPARLGVFALRPLSVGHEQFRADRGYRIGAAQDFLYAGERRCADAFDPEKRGGGKKVVG